MRKTIDLSTVRAGLIPGTERLKWSNGLAFHSKYDFTVAPVFEGRQFKWAVHKDGKSVVCGYEPTEYLAKQRCEAFLLRNPPT